METTTKNVTGGSLNFDHRAVRRGVRRVRREEMLLRFLGWGERRTRRRVPVRRTVYVTPVELQGQTAALVKPGTPFTVACTTDVSTQGVGFYHDEPLPTRYAIMTFDRLDEKPVSLVVEIVWSQCRADRWYRSGGKFIAVAKTPEFLYLPHRRGSASEPPE